VRRAFLTNIILLAAANLLIKPFYLFGIERKVQFLLGNEAYGYYYNLFNFTLILQFIGDFGLQNYTLRLLSQHRSQTANLVGAMNGLKIALTLIYFLLTLLMAWIWYGSTLDAGFIFHLAFNQVLISLIFFLRAQIAGLGFYKTDSLLSVSDRLILIFSLGCLIYLPGLTDLLTVATFVWVQTFSLGLVTLFCILFIAGKGIKFFPLKVDFNAWINAFRFCVPFALIYFTNALFSKADSIWLQRLLPDGQSEAGIYAYCYRFYDALCIISLSFGGLLLPMFARLHQDDQRRQLLLKASMNMLWIISVILGLGCFFFSGEIQKYVTKDMTEHSQRIIGWLALSFIPGSINYIFGAFFQATHRERLLYRIYAGVAVLSIILNYIFIPHWKGEGSALVCMISQSILLLISSVFIWEEIRRIGIQFFRWMIFSLLTAGIMYVVQKSSWGDLSFRLFILFVSLPCLAYLTGVLRPSDIREWIADTNK